MLEKKEHKIKKVHFALIGGNPRGHSQWPTHPGYAFWFKM